jgi:hypothetical protein
MLHETTSEVNSDGTRDGNSRISASKRLGVTHSHFAPNSTSAVSRLSLRHGGDLVAEALVREGVQFLFTLVGGHISPVLISSRERGIRVIDVSHAATSVFAADAVARMAGPGLTNTLTALKNTQMANTPLVLLGMPLALWATTRLKSMGSYTPFKLWFTIISFYSQISEDPSLNLLIILSSYLRDSFDNSLRHDLAEFLPFFHSLISFYSLFLLSQTHISHLDTNTPQSHSRFIH